MNSVPIKRRTLLASSLLWGAGIPAFANNGSDTAGWPQRPIRMVLAGSAGAGGDIFARLVATPLG